MHTLTHLLVDDDASQSRIAGCKGHGSQSARTMGKFCSLLSPVYVFPPHCPHSETAKAGVAAKAARKARKDKNMIFWRGTVQKIQVEEDPVLMLPRHGSVGSRGIAFVSDGDMKFG